MTDPARSGTRGEKQTFKDYLYLFGLAIFAVAFGIILSGLLGEARPVQAAGPNSDQASATRKRDEEYRRELRLYVLGFGLALVLTIVPFGLVDWSVSSPLGLIVAIGAFALVQVLVHFRCFLHIDPPRQNMDDLHLILFSSLLLFFMVGGTIWIMANLAMRMH